MLCQTCEKREATVHLTQPTTTCSSKGFHLCQDCADSLFAAGPETNHFRGLICLSDFYRDKLYDILESTRPEIFYDGDDEQQSAQASEALEAFLREHLKKDNVQLNEDAFQMLRSDFCFSHHYYARADKVNKRDPEP